MFSDNSIFFLILDNINHFANSAAHIHEVHFYFRCPNALSENLGKNTFGDKVTLVKDQNYICPSDGYFRVVCGYQEKSRAVGFINDINLVALSSTNSSSVVINNSMALIIFVRAGMTIKYTGTNAQGYFIPLI